jgi:mono/diheme cytochrome c family protein
MIVSLLLSSLIACGGGDKAAEAPKAEAPKVEAPKAEAPKPDAPAAGGAYTPDEYAAKAYAAAKAAGADGKPNPVAGKPEAIAKGKAQYATVCASCHGPAGKGDGPAGQVIVPKAANLSDKARWDFTSVGTKHWILRNGIAGSGMAALVQDDTQAWELLAYIEAEIVGK